MKMLDLAWQKVKTSTDANCFAKAGISKDQQKSAQSVATILSKIFKIRSKRLMILILQVRQLKISADENVMSTVNLIKDDKLIEEVNEYSKCRLC